MNEERRRKRTRRRRRGRRRRTRDICTAVKGRQGELEMRRGSRVVNILMSPVVNVSMYFSTIFA